MVGADPVPRHLGAVLGLACLILRPPLVLGQTVRGTLVTEGTEQPVAGALVELLGDDGEPVDSDIASASGAFLLQPTGLGAHRIRVQRIGYERWVSHRFTVEVEGDLSMTFEVPVAPVALPELFVEGEGRCRTSPEEGRRAYDRYIEAVQALEPVVWAEAGGMYVFQVRVEETLPDIPKPKNYWYQPPPPATVFVPRPIDTLTPAELARTGYIQPDDTGTLHYYPVTAAVFVSAEFRDTHCFTTTYEHEKRRLGLTFEPLPGREVADVKGTLWLDEMTGGAVELDYRFTQLKRILEQFEVPNVYINHRARLDRDPRMTGYVLSFGSLQLIGTYGGSLAFEQLSTGAWITRRWELRIPLLGAGGQSHWELRPPRSEVRPVAIRRVRNGTVLAVVKHRD